MYLTPGRFRDMGLGADLSDIDDVELGSILNRASSLVDSYCNQPMLPQDHDFRGGTSIGEEHYWEVGNDLKPGQRRVYPWHQPVQSVTKFDIMLTNTQKVGIAPAELFIQNSEGYIEVVALAVTTIGIFGAAILPNVGLARPVARFDYTYGWKFTSTKETLYNSDANIYRAMNQWWYEDPAPVVYKNGTVIDSGFTIDFDEGALTFDAPLDIGDVIKADYNFKLPSPIADATGMLAAREIGEARLRGRGIFSNVARISIAELTIQRNIPSVRGGATMPVQNRALMDMPDIAMMLEPYAYYTVR